ncbi:MAG: lysophospholipid acyltransferase family protein [Planctomycetia bacterium]|nr:lysophospholipid acyltransferase family protein [Planctomycetia bacterium]
MGRERLRHWIEYLLFRIAVCIVQALSPRMCAQAAERLAAVIHSRTLRKWPLYCKLTRYNVARDNIRASFGDKYTDDQVDRLIYRMWVNLFRLVAEMAHMPRKLRLGNVVDAIIFRNKPDVVRALCSNRPVIVLSGHFGNWELAVSVFGLFGFRMGLVARALDNPFIDRWVYESRKFTGHRPISKNGGGGEMVALLERGGSLAMLCDQDAGKSGLFVNFFGRPASSFKSIALLAIEYRALICVGYARRLENETLPGGWPRFELGCEEVVDPLEFQTADAVREITQRYTDALERVVRRAPEQYFWVHRRWKNVPRSRASRRSKAA